MAFAMVGLKRSRTGLWTARKEIPADVRAAYGKREEKKSWPAVLTAGQAKAELAAWLIPIEERIAALRAMVGQAPLRLSPRQARALAGEWYKALAAQHDENPGTVEGWEDTAIEPLIDPDSGAKLPFLVAQRDAFLADRSLHVDASSAAALLEQMEDLWPDLCRLMQRRAQGD